MVPPRYMPKKPAKKASKRGRPPKPPGEARTEWIRLRATPAEKAALSQAASERGMTVTDFVFEATGIAGDTKKR